MSADKLAQALRDLLAKVRRDAPDLSGKLLGHCDSVLAAHEAAPQQAQATGWQPVPKKITEEQHVAACKVLLRANGLDGLPQRMLDAIRAAAPQAWARTDEQCIRAAVAARAEEGGTPDLCQNCGDLAYPGCNSEFQGEPACRFWPSKQDAIK